MVAHNCLGKSINLTAKRKTSRQKEKDSGQKKITSPCGKKEKTRGKKRNLTGKKIDSKQKEKHTAKRKRLTAKFLRCQEDNLILISFALGSWLFFLPWGFPFCCEVNCCRPPYLWNSFPEDSWLFNMWVFVRTSKNFAHLTSFQAIEFMDWPLPKTLDIFVCQASENKAFKMRHSVTVVREERELDLISSAVSTFFARSA